MSGPGARITVAPPLRTAPSVSLLTSADLAPPLAASPAPGQGTGAREGWPVPVPEPGLIDGAVQGVAIGPGQNPERWLNGITYEPEKCGGGGAQYLGAALGSAWSGVTKTVAANSSAVVTDPFLVYAGDKCSTMGWEARDYIGRATRLLQACEPSLVEHEFWTGTASKAAVVAGIDYSDTQYLAQSTTCTTLNSGTALDTSKALGLLYEALAGCACGGRSMLHVPPILFPHVSANAFMGIRRDGARLVDFRDNVIVPGTGYANTGPDGTAPSAGHAWLYATGMVRIWRGEPTILPGSYAEALDRTANTVTFLAERPYLVDWDRCCHFAVLCNLIDA